MYKASQSLLMCNIIKQKIDCDYFKCSKILPTFLRYQKYELLITEANNILILNIPSFNIQLDTTIDVEKIYSMYLIK